MSFLDQELLSQNIKKEKLPEKIKITRTDLSLQFLLAKDIITTYKVIFIVNINSSVKQQNPSLPLTPSNVNMESLRNSIISNIDLFDRKYMVLSQFDTRKAIFHFETKKWLSDATKNIKIRTHLSKFDRSFTFGIMPPRMIMHDILRDIFAKFITRKFKKWIKENRKDFTFFKYLIPKSLQRQIRTRTIDMFDWYYDIQWNMVVAKLKPEWVIALLYTVGLATEKIKKSDVINKSKNELFAVKVKKNIEQFDRKKWIEYTRKKFI